MIVYTEIDNPIVRVAIAGDERGIHEIRFLEGAGRRTPDPSWRRDDRALRAAARELRAYFGGELRTFSMALAPSGTPFQMDVWQALAAIPYGETTSYGELARRISRPRAVRAVGAANGANPLPIVLPCHRVVGSNGSLTGYGGGLPIKRALLALEQGELHGQRKMFAGAARKA